MATGDQADFILRLKRLLPRRWFPDVSPVLDGVLAGVASGWATLYSVYLFVLAQTRLATATGEWLDMAAFDFTRGAIVRKPGQGDAAFSARLRAAIFQPRVTRAALVAALTTLTGRAPRVFEPALPSDTGGYGGLGMTAGTGLGYAGAGAAGAGGYGSLALPFQCFVVAYRATGGGIPNVAGYYLGSDQPITLGGAPVTVQGAPVTIKSGGSLGGYGIGAVQWGSLAMSQGQITDADIDATIAATLPAATIAWTAISN